MSNLEIATTPAAARRLYETMRAKVASVRRRLGSPLTLADKILAGHLDDPEAQEWSPGRSYLALRPDRVVFQDVLGQTGDAAVHADAAARASRCRRRSTATT